MKKRKSSAAPARLAIVGALTVSEAARWRGEIELCIKSAPTSELDLSGVEVVDTIGAQLLVAASKMAQRLSRSLLLRDASSPVEAAFAAAGLNLEAFQNINPPTQ